MFASHSVHKYLAHFLLAMETNVSMLFHYKPHASTRGLDRD